MKIKIAKYAGYCMGVQLAMKKVLNLKRENRNEPIVTYGPLIHNNVTLNLLKKRNISYTTDINNTYRKNTVIRAHGITPNERHQLKKQSKSLIDCTCPDVGKIQSIAKRYSNNNFHIIIIGDKGHAEVEGLIGYSNNNFSVIGNEDDINYIPLTHEKYCIISQSTQFINDFDIRVKKIKELLADKKIEIYNTICESTRKRQNEIIGMSKECDLIIVIGGKNSANTKRLVDISQDTGTDTLHIQEPDNITFDMISNYNCVGITAGASTPSWLINQVVNKIRYLDKYNNRRFLYYLELFFKIFFDSNLYTGIGAGFLTYANCLMLHLPVRISYLLLSFSFIVTMHVIKQLTDITKPLSKSETLYDDKNFRILMIFFCILTATLCTVTAYRLNIISFIIILISLTSGLLYILPFKHISSQLLKNFPASKEVYVSVAWSIITVIIPFLNTNADNYISLIVYSFFIFSILFIRTTLFDLSDIYENLLMGKETLPTLIGEKKSFLLMEITLFVNAVLLLIFKLSGYFGRITNLYLLILLYISVFFYFYKKEKITRSNIILFFIDIQFYLFGIAAYIFK